MKVTTEDLGSRQVMLTIEVDEERVERTLRGVARRVSRNYNIPGFRRGRAPYSVVLQRFGREALLQEAMEDLIQELYTEALDSEELAPYDVGELEDVQLDPLVLKLRVPLRPTVEIGNYRELRVEPPVVTVEEEEVDAELERLREANAILEPVAGREAEIGDWVSLDVAATLDAETLVREEEYEMVLDPDDDQFEDGFAQQIVGLKAGDEKAFALTLSDDWGETRAGQEAAFDVTVRELRSRTLPGLDDDLARTVGDFDTLDELRESVRDQFEENAQQEADAAYIEEVFDVFVSEAEIEYPPDMVEDQIDSIVEDIEARLESQGLSLEDYFKFTNQSEEEFRESSRPQAERAIQRGLMMGELATQEHLDVEGQEVEERIAALSTQWGERAGDVREALSEPDSVRSIASGVLTDKAVQRMVAIAKGEAPPLEEIEAESEAEVPAGALEAELAPADDASVPGDRDELAEDSGEPSEGADQVLLDDSEADQSQAEETPIIEVEHSTETE